ncbi:FAD-dependent oxidoreductase [Desertivirga xinjiangensis]|uniref:FAD-dependent oxidoreductase n=1 Tax=Desertivirga xinjiangensis TaxID=539206 RepID=UPI002109608C|nr:FAD-dependent oxidoreductase [Pedobacter xinjiangensis]
MQKKIETFDVLVIGGGLAGFCAAVAAARLGSKTCIVQNRPVFGGNSSSEIRVTPHGACAFHAYARETGIISELLIEERAQNHEAIFENGWTNSVWDLTLYNLAQSTPNLFIHVNTEAYDVLMNSDQEIKGVLARQQNAELELILEAKIFIDASGDGIVAERAGCEYRLGSEGKDEFNEPHAPEVASKDVMGNSIHFKTKDVGKPVPFTAPDWAIEYDDASFFYKQGRLPKEERGGYWWLEIGVPYNTITDNETIRHELTRHALGVWDWMKNKDPKMMERTRNYALDWIGQVPGKRESRRIMGLYLMTEHDPQNCTVFDDEIAFGGWFIDLHTPGGLLAEHSEPASNENYSTFSEYAVKSYAGPYGIPLRSLISKNVGNLMMAGRNVSVTHAALGTVRVMNTTALMGQAAGTAAALAIQNKIPVSEAPSKLINRIQQQLLRDGCFLPNYKNTDSDDLALSASVSASSEAFLLGAGPESRGCHEGLKIWRDQPQYVLERLENRKGQLIATGSSRIEKISVFLNNTLGRDEMVAYEVKLVDNIWDYRVTGIPLLAKGEAVVPPGKSWVELNVDIESLPDNRYIRLDLLPNPEVEWLIAGRIESAHVAMYQISENKMRRFGNGETLSFKVEPPQACFKAQNVISGVSRPHRSANLWKSDPNLPLPQSIELTWAELKSLSEIQLTFPGHLLREYHAYEPFYRDPQCPKDYSVEAFLEGNWETVIEVKNNYQRQNKHRLLHAIDTDRIRISVNATNGDPSAQIYEIRCY